METGININSGPLLLEGLLEEQKTDRAVIVTHPHPLYGGEMHNNVVSSARQAFYEKGYSTLRFNFRGTGCSEGNHDDGDGEKDDMAAAVAFLKEAGYRDISIAGYSFGAWVSLMAVAEGKADPSELFLIAPPVDFIEFRDVSGIDSLKLVLTGDRDQFASSRRVETLAGQWNGNAEFIKINGCDHFFSGYMDRLQKIILEF